MTSRIVTIALLMVTVASGCATNSQQAYSVDAGQRGVESMSQVREPIYLTANRPGLSLVGKDYLFTGPVTVAGSGPAQDYLWFAVGSTIDRELTGAAEPVLDEILLVIDGVPMTFDLIPWSQAAQYSPYKLDVKTHASYAARITRSQVRTIAAAQELTAYVTGDDHRSPVYTMMGGELRRWLDF